MKNAVYTSRIMFAIVIFLLLTSCGSSSGSDSDDADTKGEVASSQDPLASIALESKDKLPKCHKDNDTQLSYIIDEDMFYTCSEGEWVEVDAQGKDGKTVEVDNEIYHSWTDPFTSLTWVFAGTSDYQSFSYSAVQTCATSGFRMPTKAEGVAAKAHGIRSIATELGHNEDFWVESDTTGGALPWRINVNGSQQVVATTTNSIFCIKI